MECQFYEPLYWNKDLGIFQSPEADGKHSEHFKFSKMVCDEGQVFELIENETTEASFYLDKSFSYGDFFLIFALMIFTLFKIVEIIWVKFVERK